MRSGPGLNAIEPRREETSRGERRYDEVGARRELVGHDEASDLDPRGTFSGDRVRVLGNIGADRDGGAVSTHGGGATSMHGGRALAENDAAGHEVCEEVGHENERLDRSTRGTVRCLGDRVRVLAGRRGKPDGGATSTHGGRTLPENDAVGLEVDKLPRNNASDKELLDESVEEVAAL